jgi:phage-related protein
MEQMAKGSTEKRLELVADALLKIQDPIQRAAMGQKLFGRSYLQLAPILAKGSKGIRENIKHVRELGATMDEKGVKSSLEAAKAQRDLNTAMTGLQVTVGTALLPTLTPLIKSFGKLLVSAQPLFRLIAKNPKIVMGLVAAIWALNFAMTANPVVAITVGIIALGAAFYLAYKKCKPFRDIVNSIWAGMKVAFGWVKTHWKLLAVLLFGPIALAAIKIGEHFGEIRKAVGETVAFIFRVIRGVASFIGRAVERIGSAISKVTGPVRAIAGAAGKGVGFAKGLGAHVGLATGGMVTQAGQVLVGERGPELLSLPAGSQVTPLSTPALVAHGAGPTSMIAKVYLDKRVLATAVAEVGADRRARR